MSSCALLVAGDELAGIATDSRPLWSMILPAQPLTIARSMNANWRNSSYVVSPLSQRCASIGGFACGSVPLLALRTVCGDG